MWSLEVPLIKAADSYRTCAASATMRDGRRKALLNASDNVGRAGQRFRQAASSKSLHELEAVDFTVPEIGSDDFIQWVYVNGMRAVAGAKIRGKLMTAPRNERCPLCRQGVVNQLDHFMPKSLFPALCVDPLNLVPVCQQCNNIKGDRLPDTLETTLLHPYLDRISHERWLDARIAHESEVVRLEFFVTPPDSWDITLAARATYHFQLLQLGWRFSTVANRTIGDLTFRINQQRTAGGAALVRAYLQDEAATRFADDLNSVEGVTCATLADDDRYCQGPSWTG